MDLHKRLPLILTVPKNLVYCLYSLLSYNIFSLDADVRGFHSVKKIPSVFFKYPTQGLEKIHPCSNFNLVVIKLFSL